MKAYIFIFLLSLCFTKYENDPSKFTISRIHYGGGGDWYSDPRSLPNLIDFIKKNTSILINDEEKVVKIGDDNFYFSTYFYITGHGKIKFSNQINIKKT